MSEYTFFLNPYGRNNKNSLLSWNSQSTKGNRQSKKYIKSSGKIKEVRQIVLLVGNALSAILNVMEKQDCTEKMTFENRRKLWE